MSKTYLRAYNNGSVELPCDMNEEDINVTNGLQHCFDLSNGNFIDRRYCFEVDFLKLNGRDAFPTAKTYPTKSGNWNLSNIMTERDPSGIEMMPVDTSCVNLLPVEYMVSGFIMIKSLKQIPDDYNPPVTAGVYTRESYNWKGYMLGTIKNLADKGWVYFIGKFPVYAGTDANIKVNKICPWFQIASDSPTIRDTVDVTFRDVAYTPINNYKFVDIKNSIRYIVMEISGFVNNSGDKYSLLNKWCNIIEIEAYNKEGVNVALNKKVTSNYPGKYDNINIITDGITTNDTWFEINKVLQPDAPNLFKITIDLGQVYDIDKLKIFNYNTVSRVYSYVITVGDNLNEMTMVYNNDFDSPWRQTLIPILDPECSLGNTINLSNTNLRNSYNSLLKTSTKKDINPDLYKLAKTTNAITEIKPIKDTNICPPINTDYVIIIKPNTTTDNYNARIYFPNIQKNEYTGKIVTVSCWAFVEIGCTAPYCSINVEEVPGYANAYEKYDMTKKGTWQYLTASYYQKLPSTNVTVDFLNPFMTFAWGDKWHEGNIYICCPNIMYSNNVGPLTETNVYPLKEQISLPINNIYKQKGSLYLEFGLFYTKDNIDRHLFHMINNDGSKSIELFYNDYGIKCIFDGNELYCKDIINLKDYKNKLVLTWGNNRIYMTLNGTTVFKDVQNINIHESINKFIIGNKLNNGVYENEFGDKIYRLASYDICLSQEERNKLTRKINRFCMNQNYIETNEYNETPLTNKISTLANDVRVAHFPLYDDFRDIYSNTVLDNNIALLSNKVFTDNGLYFGYSPKNLWYMKYPNQNVIVNSSNTVMRFVEVEQNINYTINFDYVINSTTRPLNIQLWFGTETEKNNLQTITLQPKGYVTKHKEIIFKNTTSTKLYMTFASEAVSSIENIIITRDYGLMTNYNSRVDINNNDAFAFNIKNTFENDWSKSFTLIYTVKAKRGLYTNIEMTHGQIAYAAICGKYFIGKTSANSNDFYIPGQNPDLIGGMSKEDWYDSNIIIIAYNSISGTIESSIITESGKSFTFKRTYGALTYDGIKFKVKNSYEADFCIGMFNANCEDMSPSCVRDLVYIEQFLSKKEALELYSPISIGANSMRAGFEFSEGNIL